MKIAINIMLICITAVTISTGQEVIQRNEIIINELMYNPAKNGYDYVEGYNRSIRKIDLKTIRISNRNAGGGISAPRTVSKETVMLAPGQYFVVTADETWIRQQFSVPPDAIICETGSLPSFPDDEGTVILLDPDGSVVDELNYEKSWQFALIAEPDGVALERINPDAPTNDRNNWTSASSSSGYGTPGRVNSQFRATPGTNGDISVYPPVFSPDNDGLDDFGQISYSTFGPGFVCNLVIYDASGRRVRYLVKNQVMGATGTFRWDGLDDYARPLPQGIYILFAEIFNLKGERKKYRNTMVITRRAY